MITFKKFPRTAFLCAAVLLSSSVPALAQRGGGAWEGPSPRSNSKFLKAFHDSVVEASQSTVRILCDDKEVALGTVVGPDGWIVTKFSQLSGKPVCKFGLATKLDAKIVGIQEAFDVALLKVEATGLKPVTFVDSKVAPVGSWVVSVGPGEVPIAVGVMSVAARTPPPVLNRGPGRGGNFVPPPDYLGLNVVLDGSSARVVRVASQGPAAKAGIKIDDEILSVHGQAITDQRSLNSVLSKLKIGDSVAIKVSRDGEELDLQAKLELPDPLGISVTLEGKTAKVVEVAPRSAAERAAVHKGDEIVSIGGSKVTDQKSLQSLLAKMRPNDPVTIKVLREGKELELHARIRGQRGGRQDQNQMGSELSEKRSGFPTYFQTDTVIKPKDCGGPVCDLDGHVIGINIARAGRVESFSIPSPSLTALLPELKSGKFSPDLVALRKKIAELKTLVKKTADEKPATENKGSNPQIALNELGQRVSNYQAPSTESAEILKKLKEAEEALDRAEKSLKDKK